MGPILGKNFVKNYLTNYNTLTLMIFFLCRRCYGRGVWGNSPIVWGLKPFKIYWMYQAYFLSLTMLILNVVFTFNFSNIKYKLRFTFGKFFFVWRKINHRNAQSDLFGFKDIQFVSKYQKMKLCHIREIATNETSAKRGKACLGINNLHYF
jgi:hypothetical protein